ncbi:MAG: hypothetical protein IAF94_11295 [Pirellulaceae bacterium]|nr:hypothetical protein [Pirellulaceae bacterium]
MPETDPEEAADPSVSNDTLGAIRLSIQDQSTKGKRDYLSLLQDLTPEDAPKMIAMFQELGHLGFPTPEYDRLFWQRWAEIDGAAASAMMFDRDKRFKETNLSNLAISTWAKNDPDAATAWLFSQEDIPLREGMTKGLIEGMAEHDPAAAMRFLDYTDLSTEQLAHGYAQVAKQYHIQEGLDAVGQWYGEMAADDPNLELVINAATQIYARAPIAEALAWADSLDGSSAAGSRTRDQLYARIASGRPDNLLVYLGKEPGASALNGVGPLAQQAVARWTQTNPGAMANWLKNNREIPNYDLVTTPFAVQIASQDPEAALAWADTLRDPDLRSAVRDQIAAMGNGGQ